MLVTWEVCSRLFMSWRHLWKAKWSEIEQHPNFLCPDSLFEHKAYFAHQKGIQHVGPFQSPPITVRELNIDYRNTTIIINHTMLISFLILFDSACKRVILQSFVGLARPAVGSWELAKSVGSTRDLVLILAAQAFPPDSFLAPDVGSLSSERKGLALWSIV